MHETQRFTNSEQALREEVIRGAGCDDFGDPSYREGLRVVLDARDREAKFHPAGRQAARAVLVRQLTTRLRSQRLLGEHRASLAGDIRRPIIVLGLVHGRGRSRPRVGFRSGSRRRHGADSHDPGGG